MNYASNQIIFVWFSTTRYVVECINSDMPTNKNKNSVMSDNNSKSKNSIAKGANNQENDNINNSSKSNSKDTDPSVV